MVLHHWLAGESRALLIQALFLFFKHLLSKTARTFTTQKDKSLFLLRGVGVEEVGPVPYVETDEDPGQQNQRGLVDQLDEFRLGVRVEEEDCAELDQLQEDEDDAGDHPHVEAGHVGHARD